MAILVLGLLLFLGAHSVRVFADDWRSATIARIGEGPWKGIYSLVSLAGFVLLIWGYAGARQQVPLWDPPSIMRHVTAILMLPVMVLLVAGSIPVRNAFRARLHHPQVLSVKLWALAHLLSNGNAADVLLFGALFAWAIVVFTSERKRDRSLGKVYPPGTPRGTAIVVVIGLGLYAAFILGLHALLFGVRPV